MTLVYRSVFSDADGRIVEAVLPAFRSWLSSKGFSPPEDVPASGVALEADGGGDMAWVARSALDLPTGGVLTRLRLVEESESARWVTTLAWTSESDGKEGRPWVWLDLEHEPVGTQPPIRPGSPRVLRDLLAAGEAFDDQVPLTAEAWTVTTGQVAELGRYILSPTRQIPIVVFAHDGQSAYDQDQLARRLARDLAGVAAVFILASGEATDRLAQSLPPDYAVYGGSLRTYLAGVGGEHDVPLRHRVLGRATLKALKARAFPAVKDQILELSTHRAAPLRLVSSAQQTQPSPRPVESSPSIPTSAPPQPVVPSQADVADTLSVPKLWFTQRVAAIREALGRRASATTDAGEVDELDHALSELVEVVRSGSAPPIDHVGAASIQLEEVRRDRELLDQLLSTSQDEVDQLTAELADARRQLDETLLEATEAAELADRAERRARWLLRGQIESSEQQTPLALPDAPPSVAEVLLLAREHLSEHLWVGDTDETAAELDLAGASQLYAIKAWSALIALDAYARARSEGRFSNNFYAWCQDVPSGEPAISATAVALVESETVANRPDLRDARTFRVPTEVEPGQRLYMPAHIKVVKRGSPCPRLHFHDGSGKTGKVYVGYLGEHLPTARFS
ncbi:hypothetical protein [Nocardioides marmoribigeumensis]|uniref:ABC-type transporter Mla subunit MlaD n=1 Tax=Nocardioides marmoribigeumensis TaxID=433649 RepID=A0ABU2BY89_9ACTN|nr:hypothetical protein [Nocardioides marmoribigeumensis]MDR7363366.1 ABC-type transporter Mla subunit MlaD [Nocardioides marmoribigeumensis]